MVFYQPCGLITGQPLEASRKDERLSSQWQCRSSPLLRGGADGHAIGAEPLYDEAVSLFCKKRKQTGGDFRTDLADFLKSFLISRHEVLQSRKFSSQNFGHVLADLPDT